MIPRNRPLKTAFIGLKCDEETKKNLENMAATYDMTVSALIFRLISSGVAIEKARRDKIKKILEE